MKLKTLKDLELCCTVHSVPEEDWACPYAERKIKAEAIKWVKYYQQIKYNEPNYAKRRIQIQWIEHFFNITSEDLK